MIVYTAKGYWVVRDGRAIAGPFATRAIAGAWARAHQDEIALAA